jgi:hypothetical protein
VLLIAMSKRPKTPSKADADAACRKQLRKVLKREPDAAELAAAVKIYRASYRATSDAVDMVLKKPRRVG